MATYQVTDPETGRVIRLTGESPPTEQELEQIFKSIPANKTMLQKADQAVMAIPGGAQLAEVGAGVGRAMAGVADIVPNAANELLAASGSEARIPTISGSGAVANRGDFVGEGMQANILGGVGEVLPMAVTAGASLRGAAGLLPKTAPATESVGKGVLRTLGSSTPAQDVAAGTASAIGAEIGREAGGDTGAMVGSVVAPSIPGIAAGGANAIRNALRGGEAGRAAAKEAIEQAAMAGTNITAGTATGNKSLQALENTSAKIMGGRPLASAAERSTEDLKTRIAQIADSVSMTRGEENAGRVISNAIKGKGGFIDRFKGQSSQLWNEADNAIGLNTKIDTSNTANVLNDLVRTDEFGAILNTPKLAQLKSTIDNRKVSPLILPADLVAELRGKLTFETVRELRSVIGAKLSNTELVSDIPKAELKRLYGALSEDIRTAAASAGADATRSFNRANNYTRSGHNRIDGFLENVMRKVDFTKVYDAVAKGGEGSQVVNAFKRSMKPEEWEIVASNVIRKLGQSTPGQQGAEGAEFSINKMLTDWNKLGPAKKALFSGSRTLDHYARDLDAVAKTAERIKFAGKTNANTSGTGQFNTNVATAAAMGTAAATGNAGTFALILSGVAANNGAARLMTNPRFVTWLAGTSKAKPQELGSQLVKLAAIQRSMPLEEAEAVNSLINQLENDSNSTTNNSETNNPP